MPAHVSGVSWRLVHLADSHGVNLSVASLVAHASFSKIWIQCNSPRKCGLWGLCKAAPRRASGASWRGRGKGPCNRSAMAAADTRRRKTLCPPAEATEALDHVDADPEPRHVEVSPMKKRKKSDAGVAAGATWLGHARSLAEAMRLCPCFSQIHKDTLWRWQKLPSVLSVHGPGRLAVL